MRPRISFGGEAERHGPHHARYDAEIVKLPHRPIDAEPMHANGGIEVDYLHTAPGLRIRLGELLVEA
jgi:hypothetical protein